MRRVFKAGTTGSRTIEFGGSGNSTTTEQGRKFTSIGVEGLVPAERLAEVEESAFERGILEGQHRARTEIEQTATVLKESARQLAQAGAQWIEAHEQEILTLVLVMAKRIAEREIMAKPELIWERLKKALLSWSSQGRLTLRVHPKDEAVIATSLGSDFPMIDIKSDSAVTRYGAILSSDQGELDLSIHSRVQAIADTLGVEELYAKIKEPSSDA